MTAPAATAPVAAAGQAPDATGLSGRATQLRNQMLGRIDSIDLVRGIVMVIMLLDHTRDFTHATGFIYDALDNARTTPWLYLTRWVTHLCAPTFVFLAGTSSGIQRLRGSSPSDLARFLWTRGLWLVFLEFTVVRVVTWWNVGPSMLAMLQVIWAIGIAMIALAAVVRLPMRWVGAIGIAIVAGHNLLDAVQVPGFQGPDGPVPTLGAKLWMLFHQGGIFRAGGPSSPMVLALYPILPWIGVMLAGYGFAGLYAMPADRRKPLLSALAAGFVVAFFALRWGNVYGDPTPWSPQPTFARTLFSFFNVQKYGPSLQFTLATLSFTMLGLRVFDGRALTGKAAEVFITFGRVPMFFYLLQWVMAHIMGMLVALAYGGSLRIFFLNVIDTFTLNLTKFGGPLWLTYVCWISGAILLYFPCKWYAALKARRRDLVLLRYL